ncbi:MAG: EI24 domain-containing protein [Bacteroidetes bacterium]|nr:EI24 domain-containing protein [Bacteroidota bacterium]
MNKQLSFFQQFGLGIKTYGKAISFVFEKGLWMYFIYTILIALLLALGGLTLIHNLSDWLENWIMSYVTTDSENGIFHFLGSALQVLLSVGLKILFFFVFSTFSKYILLIIMSPIMALLSERTEEIITGKVYPFNLGQFLKDIWRGVMIAIRNMFIEFGFIFLGFFVVWIPIIGWVAALFLIIVSYYFYGFSMIDYVSERRRMGISQSVSFVRQHKGLAIGNGFIFALVFAIPFVGGMIAAVIAPVAACIAVMEIENKQ